MSQLVPIKWESCSTWSEHFQEIIGMDPSLVFYFSLLYASNSSFFFFFFLFLFIYLFYCDLTFALGEIRCSPSFLR